MITTVTLNASIDKAYYLDREVDCGKVMRVATCRNSAGGKGLNVARIIKLCKEEVKATGFVGGYNGAYLESLLDKDGIANSFIHIDGETRSCINILDTKYGSTEFLEPGCEVTKLEEETFLMKIDEIIAESSVVTISGSTPKGTSPEIYQKLIHKIKGLGKKVILDTSGVLLENGIKECPTLVKPNKDEIEMLFGVKIDSKSQVIDYGKKIHEMGIENVVISLGGDGAALICKEGIFRGYPPKIEAVNTVGCGDSMVGAFAVAMERNYDSKEALRFAIAVATSNALSPKTGDFDPKDCEDILHKVIVEEV